MREGTGNGRQYVLQHLTQIRNKKKKSFDAEMPFFFKSSIIQCIVSVLKSEELI